MSFDIDVIIPTHNRAAYLPKSLDSVLSQTANRRYDVIVIDDGSTDATKEAIAPYLTKYGDEQSRVRIRYAYRDKQGVVAARNFGLSQTASPWVAFLDSDDWWANDKIEKQLASMTSPEVVLSHTDFRYVNSQGETTDQGVQRPNNPCVGRCTAKLLEEDLVIFSSVLASRRAIEQAASTAEHHLPFDPRWTNAQDYDLLLRLTRFGSFAYATGPLTLYRLHDSHGAMGNLPRAFGFHARVQLDFVARYGTETGLTADDARRCVRQFLFARAESLFWQRKLEVSANLCRLAKELNVADGAFDELLAKATRPAWFYRLKDSLDAWAGRSAGRP